MPVIGCIADDFTGATDLANNLVKAGFATIQTIGVPSVNYQPSADAIVIALKSRSIAAHDAVNEALAALDWLRTKKCEKFYFKYCSTFDSTPEGNIGPVAEALMARLGCDMTIFCPAFPSAERTVYQGHLFVGEHLLNESGMEHHPLNPMTDANLVRWLARQSTHPVGLLTARMLDAGETAARNALDDMRTRGRRLIITDTLNDAHLTTIARATRDMVLVTGGSGLALGLGELYAPDRKSVEVLPAARGAALILAGSASKRTRAQIEHASTRMPTRSVDPVTLNDDFADIVDKLEQWACAHFDGPILIHSDTRPDVVRDAQQSLGVEASGQLVERALSTLAERLVARGVQRLIVAGGETAGAVVQSLGVKMLRIGSEIDPGVPWTWADSDHGPIHLALKSGNFGVPEMFTNAWDKI